MFESARNFYARTRRPDALQKRIQSVSLIRRPETTPGQMSLQDAARGLPEWRPNLRQVLERDLLPLDLPPAA
ncbi:MAG TPA: hypothetical protein VJB57_06800 [Dehalococcoidia bacterium]|nr:hypothetical protein [Dehalococcoidia bacterium]